MTSQTGKTSETCEKIFSSGSGRYNEALTLVEFIDTDSSVWRQGPDLPQKNTSSAIVQHPQGGVILVGGSDGSDQALDTLYHLPHAGEGVWWRELPIKLKTPRFGHVAMALPASYVSCNKTINALP